MEEDHHCKLYNWLVQSDSLNKCQDQVFPLTLFFCFQFKCQINRSGYHICFDLLQ